MIELCTNTANYYTTPHTKTNPAKRPLECVLSVKRYHRATQKSTTNLSNNVVSCASRHSLELNNISDDWHWFHKSDYHAIVVIIIPPQL